MGAILPIITHPAYLLACLLLALAGYRRRGGFFGFLLISAFLTPVIGLFILIVGDRSPTRVRRRRRRRRRRKVRKVRKELREDPEFREGD